MNWYLNDIDYTQSHIKSDQSGSHVFRLFLGQLSTDFHEIWKQAYLKQNTSIHENFVKLYIVFQKLDHLTCNKLKLRRPSLNPLN